MIVTWLEIICFFSCTVVRYSNTAKCILFRTVSRTGTSTDQNFITGCRYFLKKCELPVRSKTLLFIAGIFLVVIFLFPCDIVVICLCPTYRVMMIYFFCFSFCRAFELFLCLKSKKHKGSDSLPSLMGNYHKSYLHAYLCQNFRVNG